MPPFAHILSYDRIHCGKPYYVVQRALPNSMSSDEMETLVTTSLLAVKGLLREQSSLFHTTSYHLLPHVDAQRPGRSFDMSPNVNEDGPDIDEALSMLSIFKAL